MDRIVGGAIGEGLESNVKDAYLFLAANHREGDEIFIFGFSRGAFTARCVAGMVDSVGLLKPEHTNRLGRAYRQYRRILLPDEPGLKRGMTKAVGIRFLGVFDTVGALGIPIGGVDKSHRFRNNLPPECVQTARHALAIHERRKNFTPTVWQVLEDTPSAAATSLSNDPSMTPGFDIVQRWFGGVHSDIGGGYKVTKEPGIASGSYFTLKWMLAEAGNHGFVPDQGEIDQILTALNRDHNQPDPTTNGAPLRPKFELHDSMKFFYFIANIHRRIVGAIRFGDGSAVRRIVDSGAARQEFDLSPWQAYMADPDCKHICAEASDEPLLEFVIRRRSDIFRRGFRTVKIAKARELRKMAKSVAEETDSDGGSVIARLTARSDAPNHIGKTWPRVVGTLAVFGLFVFLWQLVTMELSQRGAPDLSIPADALLTTPVLLGIGLGVILIAVAYGSYLLYVGRFP